MLRGQLELLFSSAKQCICALFNVCFSYVPVLVRAIISVKRHHDHSISYKGNI